MFINEARWSGGVLASNGKIYGIPWHDVIVGIINTGIPSGLISLEFCLSAYNNKF